MKPGPVQRATVGDNGRRPRPDPYHPRRNDRPCLADHLADTNHGHREVQRSEQPVPRSIGDQNRCRRLGGG